MSPKAAADLEGIKKADAAAAAELQLAKIAWVPEIFTDREIPAAPSWGGLDDEENGDGGDSADGTVAQDGDDADTEPGTGTGAEHINDTPPDTAAVNDSTSQQSPWPFPTADGMGIGQSGPLAA